MSLFSTFRRKQRAASEAGPELSSYDGHSKAELIRIINMMKIERDEALKLYSGAKDADESFFLTNVATQTDSEPAELELIEAFQARIAELQDQLANASSISKRELEDLHSELIQAKMDAATATFDKESGVSSLKQRLEQQALIAQSTASKLKLELSAAMTEVANARTRVSHTMCIVEALRFENESLRIQQAKTHLRLKKLLQSTRRRSLSVTHSGPPLSPSRAHRPPRDWHSSHPSHLSSAQNQMPFDRSRPESAPSRPHSPVSVTPTSSNRPSSRATSIQEGSATTPESAAPTGSGTQGSPPTRYSATHTPLLSTAQLPEFRKQLSSELSLTMDEWSDELRGHMCGAAVRRGEKGSCICPDSIGDDITVPTGSPGEHRPCSDAGHGPSTLVLREATECPNGHPSGGATTTAASPAPQCEGTVVAVGSMQSRTAPPSPLTVNRPGRSGSWNRGQALAPLQATPIATLGHLDLAHPITPVVGGGSGRVRSGSTICNQRLEPQPHRHSSFSSMRTQSHSILNHEGSGGGSEEGPRSTDAPSPTSPSQHTAASPMVSSGMVGTSHFWSQSSNRRRSTGAAARLYLVSESLEPRAGEGPDAASALRTLLGAHEAHRSVDVNGADSGGTGQADHAEQEQPRAQLMMSPVVPASSNRFFPPADGTLEASPQSNASGGSPATPSTVASQASELTTTTTPPSKVRQQSRMELVDEALSRIPLLASLSRSERAVLVASVEVRSFPKHTLIHQRSTETSAIFFGT